MIFVFSFSLVILYKFVCFMAFSSSKNKSIPKFIQKEKKLIYKSARKAKRFVKRMLGKYTEEQILLRHYKNVTWKTPFKRIFIAMKRFLLTFWHFLKNIYYTFKSIFVLIRKILFTTISYILNKIKVIDRFIVHKLNTILRIFWLIIRFFTYGFRWIYFSIVSLTYK